MRGQLRYDDHFKSVAREMVQEAIEIDPAIWQAYRGIRELTPSMGDSDNIEDEVMQSFGDGQAWDRKHAE